MKRTISAAVFAIFFVSGACGLVYEVAWSRDFTVVFGGTTRATSTVVAAFMAGLALGGLLGGRWADRSRLPPLLIYGLLEGGIGGLALLVPQLIRLAQPVQALAYSAFGGQSLVLDFVRFGLGLAILLPPTMMMGATLPVLMRATLDRHDRFGRNAGRLYAINTVGALAGAGLAGFALLPHLGNRASILAAAAVNLLICLAALLLSRLGHFQPSAVGSEEPAVPAGLTGRGRIILCGYFFSGLSALGLQIVWTRSLALALGGSTYSFSLILIAYIGGLALGAAAAAPWVDKMRRPLWWAGVIEGAVGVAALVALPVMEGLNLFMFRWVDRYSAAPTILTLIRLGAALAMIAPLTFLMGALLPVLSRAVSRERPGVSEPMGLIYAANSLGAAVGAFLAGFVLLDALGIRGSTYLAAGLAVAVGSGWAAWSEPGRRTRAVTAAAVAAAGLVVWPLLPAPDPIVMNSGPFIYAALVGGSGSVEDIKKELHRRSRLLYFREDAEATVSVQQNLAGSFELRINGKVDSSSGRDMVTQILLGQLPLLLHPQPKNIMVLGLASGVTAGSILLHPVSSLDCLELSPAVIEASHYFTAASRLNYQDPRFHLIRGDGRNHLLLSGQKYDVIVSEPSNPWQLGQGMLFTRQYFELVRQSLNPAGIALSWIDAYNMDAETFGLVVRTFAEVFPHVTVWETLPFMDYMLIGSNQPLKVPYGRIKSRAEISAIAEDLARVGLTTDDLIARFVMADDDVRRAIGPGPLHTDDRRQLEFLMPRLVLAPQSQRYAEIGSRFLFRPRDEFPLDSSAEPDRQALMDKFVEWGRLRNEFLRLRIAAMTDGIGREQYLPAMEAVYGKLGGRYPGAEIRDELVEQMVAYAAELERQGRKEEAIGWARKALALNPQGPRVGQILSALKRIARERP